jgi:hypothetical protein
MDLVGVFGGISLRVQSVVMMVLQCVIVLVNVGTLELEEVHVNRELVIFVLMVLGNMVSLRVVIRLSMAVI